MLNLLAAALLGLAAHDASGQDQPAAQPLDARVVEAKGDVTFFSADEAEGMPAAPDLPLQEGDRLKVGPESSAEIAIDDGSLVRLRENTDFVYRSAKPEALVFELSLGGLLAKIRKLAAGESVQVRTLTAVAAVRGTEFAVEIDAEKPDDTYVGVFDEGKVEVTSASGGAALLSASQETKVTRGQRPTPAYQLLRLARHRAFMRQQMRRRAAALGARWKRLDPVQRLELRQKAFEHMRQRRGELRERLQQKRLDPGHRREDLRKRSEEKMQKRRDEIRRRRMQRP